MSKTYKDTKRFFLKEFMPDEYYPSENNIPSEFKRIQRRKRRAKVKNALRNNNYDTLPRFRKEDAYEWY